MTVVITKHGKIPDDDVIIPSVIDLKCEYCKTEFRATSEDLVACQATTLYGIFLKNGCPLCKKQVYRMFYKV